MRFFYILVFSLVFVNTQGKLIDSYAESFEEKSSEIDSQSSTEEEDDKQCPKGTFLLDPYDKCRPCSQCGPDLYVLEECTSEADTVCDWCYSPAAVKNFDFSVKCSDVDSFKSVFRIIVKTRRESEPQDDSYEILSRDEERLREARHWVAAANIAKFCFYFILIVFIVVVIRYVRKSRQSYRSITVMPPVLDEIDNKNIIRSACHIREKLGKKGYERLEEFV